MAAEFGVVFDLDNTLVQSKIDFRRMAQAMAEHLVVRLGADVVPEGLSQKRIAQIVEVARELSDDPHVVDELWRIAAEHERMGMENLELEPDALEVIRTLKVEGYPLAICTNNARPATLEAIRPFGDPTPFDPIVTRDEVRHLKPSPEGLQVIEREWRSKGVQSMIMVGDSWLDAKAAADAGMPVIMYRERPSRLPPVSFPVYRRIEWLSELPDILADWRLEQRA